MDARSESDSASPTTVERRSDRELVVTRTVNGPARLVFEAWTRPELFVQWWVPRSFPVRLASCELDVRVGGGYRLVFAVEGAESAFFGRYLEVVQAARIVWTNDESQDGQVSTVTFQEVDGKTLVVLHELYPSKEALDEGIASGSCSGLPETLAQLDEVVTALATGAAR